MSLSFISSAQAVATVPFPMTIYDANQNPVAPANLTWTLPAGVTVAPKADNSGVLLTSSTVQQVTVVAHMGIASGSITINFAAPALLFTTP